MSLLRTKIFIVLCIFCGSCKLTEKDVVGHYHWEQAHKTHFRLNSDKTFQFERNNPNPYLHPFDHPDENYFVTHGKWEMKEGKIVLVSNKDPLTYPRYQIKKSKATDSTLSYFAFVDSNLDPVKILYVKLSDSSMMSASHRSMNDFKFDLRKFEKLEFHFYGYRPFNFTPEHKENADFAITLFTEYRPRFFQETEFVLKRKKLIDKQAKAVFRKVE